MAFAECKRCASVHITATATCTRVVDQKSGSSAITSSRLFRLWRFSVKRVVGRIYYLQRWDGGPFSRLSQAPTKMHPNRLENDKFVMADSGVYRLASFFHAFISFVLAMRSSLMRPSSPALAPALQ